MKLFKNVSGSTCIGSTRLMMSRDVTFFISSSQCSEQLKSTIRLIVNFVLNRTSHLTLFTGISFVLSCLLLWKAFINKLYRSWLVKTGKGSDFIWSTEISGFCRYILWDLLWDLLCDLLWDLLCDLLMQSEWSETRTHCSVWVTGLVQSCQHNDSISSPVCPSVQHTHTHTHIVC